MKKNCLYLWSLVQLALLLFKVSHVIDWPWWCILFPLWLPVVLTMAATIALGIFLWIIFSIDWEKKDNEE